MISLLILVVILIQITMYVNNYYHLLEDTATPDTLYRDIFRGLKLRPSRCKDQRGCYEIHGCPVHIRTVPGNSP